MGFPKNTEMEAELTFVRQPARRPGGGGAAAAGAVAAARFLEGVGSVAATARSREHPRASLDRRAAGRELHSRARYDPRAGLLRHVSYEDFAAPLGEPMTKRFIRRHRLEKKDPSAAGQRAGQADRLLRRPRRARADSIGAARRRALVEPGVRSRRLSQRASRCELLPEGVSPLDIRYNVINWVHRSTRGWSTGGSVTDPRTGEIIKGVVTLGSLRDRQDYLIAEGLLVALQDRRRDAAGAARMGDRAHPPAVRARGRPHARPRPQLLRQRRGPHLGDGLPAPAGHAQGRRHARLLDRSTPPASASGTRSRSRYGYSGLSRRHRRSRPRCSRSSTTAWKTDLRYMTNQDTSANPRVDQWSNGTDPAAELTRMLGVRRAVAGALRRAGDQARPADGADRGGAGAALPPPPLSGRGGGVGGRRAALHLRDARRRPRAGEAGAGRASSRRRSTR